MCTKEELEAYDKITRCYKGYKFRKWIEYKIISRDKIKVGKDNMK
jgi:hypothetical protein